MRILFVTFYFPPYNTIGAVRTGKTAKYLVQMGHTVHVVSAFPQSLPDDLELEVPRSSVTYTRWLARPKLKRLPSAAAVPAAAAEATGRLVALGKRAYWELMIPDQQLGWFPFALRAARSVIRRGEVDIVFASGGPFTTLMVGRSAAHFGNLPWVAELRDLWTDDRQRERLVLRKCLEGPLERWTLGDADGLVTVTPPLVALLKAKYGDPVELIYNGYEPHEVSMARCPDPARLVIRHMGSLWEERVPHALFRSLKKLDDSGLPITMEFYGRGLGHVSRAAAAAGIERLVRCCGTVGHAESLRLQRNADVLLLALVPRVDRDALTGKLFEYMSARRPILVVGCPDGEAAKLVRSTACGFVADDEAALVSQLESWRSVKVHSGDIPDNPAPAEEFTRAEQTRRLAGFLETIVERHRSQNGSRSLAFPRRKGELQ